MIKFPIPHVYIVDDDEITLSFCKILNSSVNYCSRLQCFGEPLEAIEELKSTIKVEASIPDVIFLDINMPIIDGWRFLELLKKIEFKEVSSVFILSSSINENDIKKSMIYSQVKGFISKPLTIEKINGVIDHLNKMENLYRYSLIKELIGISNSYPMKQF